MFFTPCSSCWGARFSSRLVSSFIAVHLMVWCLLLQTPGYAVVLNPSWFCQGFSSFSSLILCCLKGVGNHGTWQPLWNCFLMLKKKGFWAESHYWRRRQCQGIWSIAQMMRHMLWEDWNLCQGLGSPIAHRYILKVTEKFSFLKQPFNVYVCLGGLRRGIMHIQTWASLSSHCTVCRPPNSVLHFLCNAQGQFLTVTICSWHLQ